MSPGTRSRTSLPFPCCGRSAGNGWAAGFPKTSRPLGLYIHVPFCKAKCGYCAFYSVSDAGPEAQAAYVEHVCEEIQARAAKGEAVDTVFFGGGTPSLLTARQIEKILDRARESFRFSPGAEISIEANPETVSAGALRDFLAAGINRISFGVQALQDRFLRALGRIHSAAQAQRAIHAAQRAGFANIGADLMFGLPEQNLTDWQESLEKVSAFPLVHLSCYELVLEEGTPMSRAQIRPPDPDLLADMWELAIDRLPKAGFTQYEIANYARAGRVCRHNLKYWHDWDFLGFGAGAWSCRSGTRFSNPRDIEKYIAGRPAGFPPAEVDRPAPQTKMAETLILNLRLRQGCREDAFKARYGADAFAGFGDVISSHLADGRLERRDGFLRLTRAGMLVADSVWGDLLAKAGKSPSCEQSPLNDRFFY